ncbi:DUF2752 domain-containing protein [Clostridium sp. 1001271B_151109_B4]|uniref:DUF2752 domain-containing protein n=1 Tax=Clostridium sp. 1001271B_151109_B4 TaxID=2787148 RepID=UPI0018AA451B|nr:DUF2752 domain-containing protein [Clostridium sp. 1001271B_151109_B4]
MKKYDKNLSIKIVFSIVIGLIIIYLILNQFSKVAGTICLIRGLTGIPCPSCGITRAMIAVLNGNFIEAFKLHPLFWMPFAIVILIILNRKYYKWILIGAIAIFIGVYIVRMSIFFPDIEPMKYNERAIINQLISKIRK